jgi:hypothetical protein
MAMRSIDGWVPLRDIYWESGYPSGIGSRVMLKLLEELGVTTKQITLPTGGQRALCIPEADAEPVVDILKARRQENLDPARRAEIMAKARASKKPDAFVRAVQTRRERGWQKEKEKREYMGPIPIKTELPPKPALLDPTPQVERRDDDFEVTVRKLIALCAKKGIDCLTIQDGKAEIVRTVSVTKEETIKG